MVGSREYGQKENRDFWASLALLAKRLCKLPGQKMRASGRCIVLDERKTLDIRKAVGVKKRTSHAYADNGRN